MGLDLEVHDHTTLSRRSLCLEVRSIRLPAHGPIHLVVDSTGLSIVGESEWAAAKYRRRGQHGWRKLHLGVDQTGAIVAHGLTTCTVDDATTGIGLIAAVDDDVARVTANAADDTIAFYEAVGRRGATVVVPPDKTARVSRRKPRSNARDRTITSVQALGRRRWKKVSGYHRQARVENTVFRYKSIIGDRLRARHSRAQETESAIACNILNRVTQLGRPASFAIGS